MSMINYASREINCKLVYYGPGLGGKTTNLEHVYKKVAPNARGKLISLATETERTLFFDFLPVDLGHHPRLQDPVPPLHRAGAGVLQRHPQADPEGRGRRGVRGRQPDRADGGEHRGDAEPVRQHGAARLRPDHASRSSSSTTSATCPTPPPIRRAAGGAQPGLAGRGPGAAAVAARSLPRRASIWSSSSDGQWIERAPYFEAVAVTGEGVFDTLKAVSKLVAQDAGLIAAGGDPRMWTLPNILTLVRICFTPVIALLPFIEGYWPKLICFIVFVAGRPSPTCSTATWPAAATRSPTSASCSIPSPTSCCSSPPSSRSTGSPATRHDLYDIPVWGSIPLWVCLLLIGREVAMTVFRWWAKRRGVVIAAGGAGKLKAAFQNIYIGRDLPLVRLPRRPEAAGLGAQPRSPSSGTSSTAASSR